jgi:hypothetical protein
MSFTILSTMIRTIKNAFSQKLGDYLIQAIFIFISVFLAFWLNEYQAKYKEAQRTVKAELAILKEMKKNLHILEIMNANRIDMIQGENETFNQSDIYKFFNLSKVVGYNRGSVRATLSKSAISLINSENINIDIDRRRQLNSVYQHQQEYEEAQKKLFDEFLISFEVKKTENVGASYVIFYTLAKRLWSREVTLIHSLKEAIAELEQEYS